MKQLFAHLNRGIDGQLTVLVLGALVSVWAFAEWYRPRYARKQDELMSSLSSGGYRTITEFARADGRKIAYKKRLVVLRVVAGLALLCSAVLIFFHH
jgi:hypothetical protein